MQNTIFDSVHKTMTHDSPRVVIPMVNEMFGEHYRGDEKIKHLEGEHYIQTEDGQIEKRSTDSYFEIKGADTNEPIAGEGEKLFHIENQSTVDNTMLSRMFEYDSQIALKQGFMEEDILTVPYPQSGVLYLRHNANTPDCMKIKMVTKKGNVMQEVQVMKLKEYTLEEIFEKDLIFLLPFHFLVYENQLLVYNENEERLEELKKVYRRIMAHLEELNAKDKLSSRDWHMLISMSKLVVEHVAAEHENVRKGILEIMGGVILDYEAKDIWNSGMAQGLSQGITQGIAQGSGKILQLIAEMTKDGLQSCIPRLAKEPDYLAQMQKKYNL